MRALLPRELLHEDNPVAQLVDVLAGCAEQVAFLSRQLLSFRRGGDLELRSVPMSELVHRAITLVQPTLRDVTIRERIQLADPVRCAPPLMVQVLSNLVENAMDAAGAGGWVEIAAGAADGKITVEIADSGPGVPAELRERVFEPFFTTKDAGKGTGLGLAIAHSLVARQGGDIQLRTAPARGATFVVRLPVEPPGGEETP